MWRRFLLVLASQAAICAVSSAHQAETPLKVSACDLSKQPGEYQHRLVTVRSKVNFGFEDFTLYAAKCEGSTDGSPTWIEFGGDLGSQTVYCCGDHSRQPGSNVELDGYELPLQKDSNFFNFLHVLNAHRDKAPTGGPCYDCFYFVVTATLSGRFFAGGWAAQKQGQASQSVGYGHLGCCSLLVVERVSDVEVQRTKIPDALRFRCRKRVWVPSNTRTDELLGGDSAVDLRDPDESGAYAMRKMAEAWGFPLPDTNPEIYRDVSNPKWERAHGTWTSADKTVAFSIELKTRSEVDASATGSARLEWIPQRISGEVCAAAQR